MMRLTARPAASATAALLLLALCLAGCSREADDWRGAQAADTTTSYQQFLHQYPKSAHVNEANTRLAQLAEDEAWQGATSQDTQMGYQQFLTRYPDGKWAQEARVRIENFSLAPLPPAPVAVAPVVPAPAASAPSAAAPVAAAAPEPPKSAPAKPEAAKPEPPKPAAAKQKEAGTKPSASGYGVQLGAFSSKAKAELAWSRLEKQFQTEFAGVKHQVVPGRAGAGQVFRLRVPQSGEPAARKLCSRLKAQNEVCVVYRP